jgi:sec-independent protein translocase protein TatA
MAGIGGWEIILFGLVAVMLFSSRLPSVARSLGQSIQEFKRGMQE